MNCKPGDLAVLVRSMSGNEGRIVRCVRYLGVIPYVVGPDAASWEIDPPIPSLQGGTTDTAPDDWLRPIRDNDGDDETLQWAGKPEEVAV
jgi:hypothetical protein